MFGFSHFLLQSRAGPSLTQLVLISTTLRLQQSCRARIINLSTAGPLLSLFPFLSRSHHLLFAALYCRCCRQSGRCFGLFQLFEPFDIAPNVELHAFPALPRLFPVAREGRPLLLAIKIVVLICLLTLLLRSSLARGFTAFFTRHLLGCAVSARA